MATDRDRVAVLAILVFLAWFSLPLFRGGADVWTWTWRPFHGHFGILPMVVGSLLLSTLALLPALALGVGVAAFVHGIAPRPLARLVLAVVHFMTGIPTIVYAFVSAMILAPFIRRIADHGTGYSLLTASLVLSVLILPTIVLLLHARWQGMAGELRLTATALGLTRTQWVLHVLLPLSGRGLLLAGIMGFARAVGDTMIALLLSGNAAQVPGSLFDAMRALTAHIALVHATDSQDAAYLSIFAAGLVLLVITGVASVLARSLHARGARGKVGEGPRRAPSR